MTWKGYETESEVLWKSIALGYRVASVRISTIYIDENRRSQFDAWRDSSRIASVFANEIAWTVATAALDIAAFIVFWKAGRLAPAPANVASRFVGVATQATFRRDFFRRSRRLMREEGTVWCVAAFVGHVTLTTMLVAGLASAGLPVIAGKTAGAACRLPGDVRGRRSGAVEARVDVRQRQSRSGFLLPSRTCRSRRCCRTCRTRRPRAGRVVAAAAPPSSAQPPCVTPLPFGSS